MQWSVVCGQQRLRQPFRFAPKDKKIATLKFNIVISALRFRREKKVPRTGLLFGLQLGERIPDVHIDFFPVIESRTFQLSIIQRKSERLDQMQGRARSKAKPADISGIRRDLRLDQDHVKHKS